LGLIKYQQDYKRGLADYVKEKQGSSFVVMRVNMFDEIVVMNQYDVDEKHSTAESLNAVLRNAISSATEDK
jgi:predicted sulfurtransferase